MDRTTSMQAKDVMTPNVISANQQVTLKEVTTHMVAGRLSGFPVTDDDQALVGLVTELDIIKALMDNLDLETTCAQDVMTREIITVAVDDAIEDIMRLLHAERIIRVPVVRDGVMVGLISRGDILRASLTAMAA